MKKNIVKLLLSVFASFTAAVSLTASTFAYVLINNKAVVSTFDFEIHGTEGLEISLDNRHWSQDILASQIKEQLIKNTEYQSFDDIQFNCTTIAQENGLIKKDENNQIKFNYLEVEGEFDDNLQKNVYHHIEKEAKANSDKGYIKFDLYFRSKSTYKEKSEYVLKTTENTKITSDLKSVRVGNRLTTKDMDDFNEYKDYNPGEYVNVDISNAIRLGIYNVDMDDEGNFTNYHDFNIYEMPNEKDLGSVALESHRGLKDIYDPEVNAMYTYYNSYFTKYPFESGALDGEAFITQNRESLLNNEFGSFVYNETNNEYNVVKLEFYIWLEGWDADYFTGVPEGTQVSVDLEFEMLKKE